MGPKDKNPPCQNLWAVRGMQMKQQLKYRALVSGVLVASVLFASCASVKDKMEAANDWVVSRLPKSSGTDQAAPPNADGLAPQASEEAPSRSRSIAGAGERVPELSPAEKQLREDESRVSSLMLGGAMNALMTKGIALLAMCQLSRATSKRNVNCTKIVTMGAALLTIHGAAEGYATAVRERKGRNERRAIQQMLDEVRADNALSRKVMANMSQVIAERKRAKKAKKAQLSAADRARDEENVEKMRSTLKEMKKATGTYREAAKKMKGNRTLIRQVNDQVSQMEARNRKLERAVAAYAKEVGTVTTG